MTRTNSLHKVRNIGIMAHIDAGKTTATERILYYTGRTHKMGEVHEGSAVMDWMEQEQNRGITITSAATTCVWKDAQIHIIDTPGHVDFTAEVERSLRVLDGAVFLLDAKEGVEPQTEVVWRQANHYHVPRLVFVNKMDMTGANFQRSVNMIQDRLGGVPVPLQLPIGAEEEFEGIISLVDQVALYNRGKAGETVESGPIPNHLVDQVDHARNQLVEALAEYDDDLMLQYLEGDFVDAPTLTTALRQATLAGQVVPVLCGAAYKNKGVQMLLDAVVAYLPSPVDIPPAKGHTSKEEEVERPADDGAPFSALVFKLMTDPFVGKLSYLRVYSGTLKAGATTYNATKKKKERVGKILQMHANERKEIEVMHTGDIVAVIGLKHTTTGDTLSTMGAPILYESMDFPVPVISVAVEPRTPGDHDKLLASLALLAEEDPTFTTQVHPDTGQLLISGMGELHLEIIVDRLLTEFKVQANVGQPQVTYKESIVQETVVDYTLSKQYGGHGLEGQVKIRVKPKERGSGHSFASSIGNRDFPKDFVTACEEGIMQSLQSGTIAGFEVIDLDVELLDASYQQDTSNEVAFRMAGSNALTQALKQGQSILLEPIFKVEVHVPENFVGAVVDDLNKRKGLVTDIDAVDKTRVVRGTVPLSNMFGYATDLRSATQGRGNYSMVFDRFGEVSKSVLARFTS